MTLYRLQPPESNVDHKEMVARGLIERAERHGTDWWTVRLNQIAGPKPTFRQYLNLDQEFEAIANYCRERIAVGNAGARFWSYHRWQLWGGFMPSQLWNTRTCNRIAQAVVVC